MKRFATLFLALAILVSAIHFFPVEAAAASSAWPDLSSSCYASYVAPAKSYSVYQNPDMTVRGSAVPKKAYNSYIDGGDDLRLLGFVNNGAGVIVSYPVGSNVRRTAYMPTKTLFGVSKPVESFIAKASVPVYKIVGNTVTKWGSTAIGDRMIRCANTANGQYILCFYEAVSGNRGWKVGFFKLSDFEKVKGNESVSQDSSNKSMSYALYKSSGGRISCGFDGYVNTKGRHEGIDLVKSYGSAVYSLTDGVITRVTQGYNGSKGLSTIAIYSETTNKTVVYLHTDPLDNLYVGQRIAKGQQIATEAWHGCSSSSGTHTHIEVRNGRKTAAAVSVGDYTLDNPNPTAFWNSQGYVVK